MANTHTSLNDLPDANMSGIKPSSFFILVKPVEVEEKTSGGLFLPNEAKEKEEWAQTRGEMIAVGPVAFEFDDWPEDKQAMKPVIGDTVFFARYSGVKAMGNDDKEYWIIKDADVMATIEG